MSPLLLSATPVALTVLTGVIVFLLWFVTRKRVAAQTIGRARQEADRILRDT